MIPKPELGFLGRALDAAGKLFCVFISVCLVAVPVMARAAFY